MLSSSFLHTSTKFSQNFQQIPILILPTSSADASADESAANFLKILCFSHFFLTFLNFLESFGYSSAPACFLTPDSSVISFKSTRKAKVWSWADRPMTKSLAGLTTHEQTMSNHQHIA